VKKIQTPTEFQTFGDGKCAVYEVVSNKLADQPVETLDFGERTIGMKRLYTARTATSEINRLVQVPQRRYISDSGKRYNAVITGMRYKIDAAQHLDSTNPPVTILTLVQIGAIT
jgi:hypothetical protein